MKNLLFYFVALFIFFFACTADQGGETDSTTTNTAANSNNEGIVAKPISAPKDPPKQHQAVPQAAKKDLVYPKRYTELGIPKMSNAIIENNVMIDNDQGKYGQRIKMKMTASYDEVYDFYEKELVKKGWERNAKMDKLVEDEDVKVFATNYMRDNDSYTLWISITKLGNQGTAVSQIVKEN